MYSTSLMFKFSFGLSSLSWEQLSCLCKHCVCSILWCTGQTNLFRLYFFPRPSLLLLSSLYCHSNANILILTICNFCSEIFHDIPACPCKAPPGRNARATKGNSMSMTSGCIQREANQRNVPRDFGRCSRRSGLFSWVCTL